MWCDSPNNDVIEQTLCELQRQDEIDAAVRAALQADQTWVQEEARDNLREEREAGEKISDTVRLIWIEEWSFIISYFQVPGQNVAAVERVEDMQRQLGFSSDAVDGVIWPNTLREIYEQEYSRNLSRVWQLQQTRWEIYTEMRDYPAKTRWVNHLDRTVALYPSSLPQVFNRDYYFWEVNGEPINWSGINAELIPHLNNRIQRQDTVAYMIEVQGHYVVAAYVQGQLAFASYASPGNPNHRDGQWIATPEWSWSAEREDQYADEHWITGAPSSVRSSWGRYISDIMPYAINVEAWIFSHAWRVNGERRSHGCIRLPLHYAHALYEIYQSSEWNMAWEIQAS